MREKELRLALVCYGGVSLAVYMHGITKEIWRLARASRAFHSDEAGCEGSQAVYLRLFRLMARECNLELRVLVDTYVVLGDDEASARARLELLDDLEPSSWTDSHVHVGTAGSLAETIGEWVAAGRTLG